MLTKDVAPDGTTEVHCHFDNYHKSLSPGMYMNAEIELNNNLQNVLPEEAIVSFEGKKYVFENTGKNKFEMIEKETGISENGFTEIYFKSRFNRKRNCNKERLYIADEFEK